jgi:hypothetical protein
MCGATEEVQPLLLLQVAVPEVTRPLPAQFAGSEGDTVACGTAPSSPPGAGLGTATEGRLLALHLLPA